MSSWYVATLLKRRDQIRSNIVSVNYATTEPLVHINLDDEDYVNLLAVERKLKELEQSRYLSKKEVQVISCILDHKSYADIHRLTGYTRITSARLFEKVCDRIAYLLGNEFIDEGYLNELKKKYKLSEEQIDKARKFMAGNKRFAESFISKEKND